MKNSNISLSLYNLQGELIKKKDISNLTNKFAMVTGKNPQYNFLLSDPSGKIFEVTQNLELKLIHDFKLSDKNTYFDVRFDDLDADGKTDYIFSTDDKLIVTDQNFKHPTFFNPNYS